MNKVKLCVIFGGKSTEHDVSIISAMSILKNLDSLKYDIYPTYIDLNGNWFIYDSLNYDLKLGEELNNTKKIDDIFSYLKSMDAAFPVLHGLYGEDGTIQGLFELINLPYVGCHVLSSSVCMDKVYSKIIFDKAGLKQTPYIYLKVINGTFIYVDEKFNESIVDDKKLVNIVAEKLKYPLFVKPSNSGSSVGVTKVNNFSELISAINEASKYDYKVLIEQGVIGREVECAVLGNEDVIASSVGEIKSAEEFYSYDSKYNNSNSYTITKADLPIDIFNEIRSLAVKAFKSVDGKGLSRVDFFVEDKTNKIIINEINTMPGFTSISMYPKLFEESGIKYKDLLDKLISLCLDKNN